MRTPLCDTFGIDVPIILAGMGGVSMAPLVAAVSNAGGLGVMGAANLSPDGLRDEIRKTRALTKKPFAVDLLAPGYGWFTEGFDTADLKEAKALLDQLA